MLHPAEQSEAPLLEEIATFLRVAELGSLTAAARELGLPKSTVSRRLTRLEEKLGAQLLHRTTRQLALTEVGAAYRERAVAAMAQLEEAAEAVRAQQDTPRGHLRVTAPFDLGLPLLSGACAEYARRYPEASVEAVLTERTLDLVGEGIDLALRAAPSLPDSTLSARRLADVQVRLYASPRYLEARGTPRAPEDLAGHLLVLLRAAQGRATLTLRGPAGEERQLAVKANTSGNDFSFVVQVLLAGGGIGAVPSIHAEVDVRAGRLSEVLPGWTAGSAGLFMVHPGSRMLSAKVRAFRELLIEQMGRCKERM